ncbi:hypothetical protein VTN00DRAFT_761 [Thermoascus crustaceus]|uniref:uncharacterized protein n=1 Tax=Thermoascus crustaceus TaxID=5088 RepID=UPI00374445D3
MSLTLEHTDACLPITAIQPLSFIDVSIIVQGQGPYTRLIDEASGVLLAQLRTFKRNNVHGFIIDEQKSQDDGSHNARILVWGGQSLRVIDITGRKDSSDRFEASLFAASAEYAAPDWILEACPSYGDDHERRAYLVTAHNALLGLDVVQNASSNYTRSIRLHQLAVGVKSILYSADVISLSATHILIAAGTVFGEVIVWSCFLEDHEIPSSNHSTSIHHFFTGHEGSIFGVCISPEVPFLVGDKSGRLLASCSDDRTIRIWNISDCCQASRQDPSAYSTDGFELRSTGFGNIAGDKGPLGSEADVAKAFGHISRIWGVQFLRAPLHDERNLSLVSRGEDATCQLWRLSWDTLPSQTTSFALQNVSTLHHHSGKNIWSFATSTSPKETVIYTGGADGALKSSRISGGTLERGTTANFKTDRVMKTFASVADDCFIAISVKGEVLLGWIQSRSPEVEQRSDITWETLSILDDLRTFSVISSVPRQGVALLGNDNGLIRLYHHQSKSLFTLIETGRRPLALYVLNFQEKNAPLFGIPGDISFVISYANSEKADLYIVKAGLDATPHVNYRSLVLPPTFQISCASFVSDNQYLVLGSKVGALAIYEVSDNGESLQCLTCVRRVHDEGVVTYISRLASLESAGDKGLEYILTCGRDGNYCVHVLEATNSTRRSVHLQTIHRSSPAFGQNVEGAYFDEGSHDLVLYGFRSNQFILWNETTQSALISLECGGVHRVWAYSPFRDTAGTGVFLWNKANNFNIFQMRTLPHRALCAGGHGREIKSTAVSNVIYGSAGALIATGAEDTTVRIFVPTNSRAESPWGAFKCLRVLNKHNTGIQQVTWSKDGRYLFTSGGVEEFFVWRIRSIPEFGIATLHEASSPKEDPASDLRITSFDVLDVEGQEGVDCFLLCLTYSNSTVKVFHYSSSADEPRFTLLAKGTYTTNCLTQANFLLSDSSIDLITCATDGHFALWDLSAAISTLFSVTSSSITPKPAFQPDTITPATISWLSRHRIHLNSIKSVELIKISKTARLLVAGGDDNALSVSLLDLDPTESIENVSIATVSIPDAHAASVTTVKLLERLQSSSQSAGPTASMLVASSGNDHRVKIWSISVDLEKKGVDAIEISEKIDKYSPVADISSMDIVRVPSNDPPGKEVSTLSPSSREFRTKLLVCGVGMEMLDVRSPSSGAT